MLSVLSSVFGNKNVRMTKQKELVVEKSKKNGSSLEEMERGDLPLQDFAALCRRQVVPMYCQCPNTVKRFHWTSRPRMEHTRVLEATEIDTAAKEISLAHIILS